MQGAAAEETCILIRPHSLCFQLYYGQRETNLAAFMLCDYSNFLSKHIL